MLTPTALVVEVQSGRAKLARRTPGGLNWILPLFALPMGKPYEYELLRFPDTYAWATARDLGALSTFRESSHQRPGFFIGSGGSLSSAVYGAYLHSVFNGGIGAGMPPLEFSTRQHLRESAVFVYSAGGGNADILSAFRHAAHQECETLAVVCLNPESKLASPHSPI